MPKQKIIYIALLVLITVFSFLGWLNLGKNLLGDSPNYGTFWIAPSLIFIIVIALFGIAIILFNDLVFALLAFLLISVGFLFVFGIKWPYLVVLALGLGVTILAVGQAIKEKKVRIKIIPSQILKTSLKAIFIVLALTVSLALYFSPATQRLSVEVKIPRPLFNVVLNTMIGVFNSQIQNQSIPSVFNIPGMPMVNINELKNTGVLNKEILIDTAFSKEAQDKLYDTINQQLNFFLKPYKQYLSYGIGIAVFFSLVAVAFVFIWLAIGLVNLIFLIMKKMGWVNIKKEMVEKETLEF